MTDRPPIHSMLGHPVYGVERTDADSLCGTVLRLQEPWARDRIIAREGLAVYEDRLAQAKREYAEALQREAATDLNP